jgi:imidazolonepropionase-like amidohydrolase
VVLVDGGRITEVAPAARYRPRPGDRLMELDPASTLLPGLIDAHVHLSLGGQPRANAGAIVRAGFTTVADLGAVSQRMLMLRDSIAAGVVEGPRVLAAGLWIGVKGGVCEFTGIGVAGGAENFRDRVRQNLAAGADLIKACVTGWPNAAWTHPDSAELSADILAAMVDEAGRANRPVVAHALSPEGVRRALDAGVAGLVHAAYLDDALIARMRDRGTWLVPTLATLGAGDSSARGRGLVEAVARAFRAAVPLVYGSDGGVLPHGRNAQEALALLAAGIPAAEILRAATVNAARALGLSDSVGAIRPGMVADLIAVPGDPLADIGVLRRPLFVMARGRVIRLDGDSTGGRRTP